MKYMRRLAPFILLAVLSGCATLPTGPSVNVLPARGKSFDTFRIEDGACRQWADRQLGSSSQKAYDQNVAAGAVTGTAIGAGLGAALGAASGHMGAGAAIGAASGLLFGAASGSNSGQLYGREAQRRYDNAYLQCMYSYGNQIPGYRRAAQAAPPVVVAPPPPPEPQDLVPPDLIFEEAPQFVYAPSLNLYVAIGVPYDLFYTGREYFYYRGGIWFSAPYYDGPWVIAPRSSYPPVFLRYRIANIRYYRDAEFRRYEHDRMHYDGRLHRPEFRGHRREQRREERR